MRYSDFGPLDITDYQTFLNLNKEQFYLTWMKKIEYKEKLEDFEPVSVLGKGTFGKIVLVRNTLSQRHRFHAMKIIEKKRVVEKKQIVNTQTEKNLMQSLNHPLMMHLDFFFQDNKFLYLIMPHIPGGDLFMQLKKFGKFSEDHSQFYAAQIILAIEYLHYISFIHRDIKPENILIDHSGYLKLTDFGFCKKMDKGRTYTLCGTPEYMAPEVLTHDGYGFAADWWAVGVLVFELNAGSSPFYSRNVTKLFKKIISNSYRAPLFFSSDLKEIINHLLQKDISKRYGNLKNGVDDIKDHQWFRSVNWLSILSRKVTAPYKPGVKKLSTMSAINLSSAFQHPLPESDEEEYKDIFENF